MFINTLALTAHFLFFLRRLYKVARVTLTGELTFVLVNTPSRVNLLTFYIFPLPFSVTAH